MRGAHVRLEVVRSLEVPPFRSTFVRSTAVKFPLSDSQIYGMAGNGMSLQIVYGSMCATIPTDRLRAEESLVAFLVVCSSYRLEKAV